MNNKRVTCSKQRQFISLGQPRHSVTYCKLSTGPLIKSFHHHDVCLIGEVSSEGVVIRSLPNSTLASRLICIDSIQKRAIIGRIMLDDVSLS